MEFLILWIMSREDLQERSISAQWLICLALVSMLRGIYVSYYHGSTSYWGLLAFLPGLLLLAVSLTAREQIGCGDAYLFLALGFGLQPVLVFRMLWDSFLLMFLWILSRQCWFFVTRKEEALDSSLPFVPYAALAASWNLILVWR